MIIVPLTEQVHKLEHPDNSRISVAERYRIAGKPDEGSALTNFAGLKEAEETCSAEAIG